MTPRDWQDFGILLAFISPVAVACITLGIKLWRACKTSEDPSNDAAKWGVFQTILIVVVGYALFAFIFTPLLFGSLYTAFFADTSSSIQGWVSLSYVNFSYALLVSLLQLTLVFWYISYRGGSLRSLGLNRLRARHPVNAVIAYGLYFLCYLVIFGLIYNFIPAIDVSQQQEIGFDSATGIELGLAFFSLVIFPPIAEELLMRGFLYRSLKKRLPYIWAVIITSGLFAVAHLQLGSGKMPLWIAAVDTFILSVFLIKLTDYSKSLWPAIFVHMIKNGVAFVSLFILST